MGRKCFVPNCKGGYAGQSVKVSTFKAPSNPEQLQKWKAKIPRQDRQITEKDCVCELHFHAAEIIRFWEKKNDAGVVLAHSDYKKPVLKPGAVPSLFPNCPAYLSQKQRPERNSPKQRKSPPQQTSKRKRPANQNVIVECDIEEDIEENTGGFNVDCVKSIDEIENWRSEVLFGTIRLLATSSQFQLPHSTWSVHVTDEPKKFVTFFQVLPQANGLSHTEMSNCT
uniref:THAP-type domain-containing protein n=1 Tax=Strigamia maritima TaxID=126957 RepID=T1IYY2_STRMM